MISNEKRTIFTHIPKCAGTSIEKAFGLTVKPSDGKHASIGDIKNHFNKQNASHLYDQYFKFTFVRNPFDQLYSFYNYHRNLISDMPKIFNFEDDFEEFLINLENGLPSERQIVSQTEQGIQGAKWAFEDMFQKRYVFINDKNQLDFIGRFETLQKDFKVVSKVCNLDYDLTHLNNSGNKAPYWHRYTKRARKLAEDLLSEDLKAFGYEF